MSPAGLLQVAVSAEERRERPGRRPPSRGSGTAAHRGDRQQLEERAPAGPAPGRGTTASGSSGTGAVAREGSRGAARTPRRSRSGQSGPERGPARGGGGRDRHRTGGGRTHRAARRTAGKPRGRRIPRRRCGSPCLSRRRDPSRRAGARPGRSGGAPAGSSAGGRSDPHPVGRPGSRPEPGRCGSSRTGVPQAARGVGGRRGNRRSAAHRGGRREGTGARAEESPNPGIPGRRAGGSCGCACQVPRQTSLRPRDRPGPPGTHPARAPLRSPRPARVAGRRAVPYGGQGGGGRARQRRVGARGPGAEVGGTDHRAGGTARLARIGGPLSARTGRGRPS